jgi:Flp pilus assembly protein TadB
LLITAKSFQLYQGETTMDLTQNHLKGMTSEEGQKQLLEKKLEVHRNRKWIVNLICAIAAIAATLCFYLRLPQAVIITVSLIFICAIIRILYRTLDKKRELRLKRFKQEQRKSTFKLYRS